MNQTTDVIQHCDRLSDQIENLESILSDLKSNIRAVQTEIDDLRNAKIAMRLEFSNTTDLQRIRELQQVLGEMDNSINSRNNELRNSVFQTDRIQSELSQIRSAFQSFGCANLRSA